MPDLVFKALAPDEVVLASFNPSGLPFSALPGEETEGVIVVDTTPPTITLVSPPEGTNLRRDQTVVLLAEDVDSEVLFVAIYAIYPSGDWAVVFDGERFAPRYRNSTIAPVATGFELHVNRAGGWTERPRFRGQVLDAEGNRA